MCLCVMVCQQLMCLCVLWCDSSECVCVCSGVSTVYVFVCYGVSAVNVFVWGECVRKKSVLKMEPARYVTVHYTQGD